MNHFVFTFSKLSTFHFLRDRDWLARAFDCYSCETIWFSLDEALSLTLPVWLWGSLLSERILICFSFFPILVESSGQRRVWWPAIGKVWPVRWNSTVKLPYEHSQSYGKRERGKISEAGKRITLVRVLLWDFTVGDILTIFLM